MKSIFIVAVMLCSLKYARQESMESLEDVLAYPTEPATTRKREVEKDSKASKQTKFIQFVEEKLIQHTQALERLLKTTANNEDLIENLIGHFAQRMEKPKMPENIEVHHPTRRSAEENTDNPIVRFGKGFLIYGNLFKDLIMRSFERDTEATPLVEHHKESRRSFGGKPMVIPSTDDHSPSPWCPIAVLCRRTYNPVCGYDDNFGYGKFDDLCHMLQVNCYWKYNFALVPSCRPVLRK